MVVSLIAAMDRNRLIGNNNQLPWHLPADLKHFKTTTMGKPIIMGRKTYDSIGRALPGRTNIVLTRSGSFQTGDAVIVHSLEDAIGAAGDAEEVLIIGGSAIYELAMPVVERLYLTLVDGVYEGDAWFPEFDLEQWRLVDEEHHSADEDNGSDYRFVTYQRK